ncbi:RNA-binding protein 38-like [Punica granatum]|uniref:Uncharacterized protein n=2 Tax=Punica granatum TaxID=22663 RepID=A0A2I0JE17_PUNGR|nr:RNA-binding protein 38-like [Punica granatum]PKI53906.1 hypothetical protein CRG98_025700 [Punica granatum]
MVDRNDGLGDTTFTKIFVGGLAWETRRDTMRCYFEQFGEILEAVVISDKNTGKSKGYGFVTFRDPESARRACENPCPVIDGRRANCNLASLGAQKNRPTATSLGGGMERFLQKPATSSSSFHGHSTYFHQTMPHSSYPYSYGYPGYSQDFFPMGYYNVYGAHHQQLPSYYASAGSGSGSGSHGFYLIYYPYYAHTGHTQYPKLAQYPVISQQFRNAVGFSSIPSSTSPLPVATARPMPVANMTVVGPGATGNVTEQKSSA